MCPTLLPHPLQLFCQSQNQIWTIYQRAIILLSTSGHTYCILKWYDLPQAQEHSELAASIKPRQLDLQGATPSTYLLADIYSLLLFEPKHSWQYCFLLQVIIYTMCLFLLYALSIPELKTFTWQIYADVVVGRWKSDVKMTVVGRWQIECLLLGLKLICNLRSFVGLTLSFATPVYVKITVLLYCPIHKYSNNCKYMQNHKL